MVGGAKVRWQLVEEEEGLAWWWRDAGTLTERQREGRLAGAAWPEVRRDGSNTMVARGSHGGLAWWSRVVVSPEVAERGGDSNDDSATVAVAAQELALLKWPEFAERNGGDSAREEERGSRFEP